MFDLASQFFHAHTVVAVGPDRSDVGAHAAAGHHIYFDTVFFQDLDYANVSQASRTSGRQRQTNAAMPYFARQSADVGVEIAIRPAAEALRRGWLWAAMNEAAHTTSHPLKQVVELFLAF